MIDSVGSLELTCRSGLLFCSIRLVMIVLYCVDLLNEFGLLIFLSLAWLVVE